MNEDYIMKLCQYYGPLVENWIRTNEKLFNFNSKVEWKFIYLNDVAAMAIYKRTEDLVLVNVASVDFGNQRNELYYVEEIIIHEMRHRYQYNMMDNFKAGIPYYEEESTIKQWIHNRENYKTCLGKDNLADYYNQPLEFDAISFAHAAMKLKYGEDIPLHVPSYYGVDFYEYVKKLTNELKSKSV